MNQINTQYFGKKVLITGHTGFKGSWLSIWLTHLGAEVVGISLDVPSEPSNFEACSISSVVVSDNRADIRDVERIRQIVHETQPDFVFHLAAEALVRRSYERPLDTLSTNAMGTANVLDALRWLDKPVVAVMITSDKVYNNEEWVWGYRETDLLGGKDPYSASKAMAELVIRSYIKSSFNLSDSNVRIGICRAGNVIGGGDWAPDRIVPDCVKAWSKGKSFDIRNPSSTRPWQHVLEPLGGYLVLGAKLSKNKNPHGEAYNFGPPGHKNFSVSELVQEMGEYWDIAPWKDISEGQGHLQEAGLLKLNCDKALCDLNWQATLQFKETVRLTAEWYKTFYQNDNGSMTNFTVAQIEEYTRFAKIRNMMWAQ